MPSRKRRIVERTCAACAVFIEYAPPASTFLHALHFQIPTAVRFTESFPQKRHVKRECWETSIFFTCLRSDEPYRTPYLPVIPTFFVLFCVCAARGQVGQRVAGRVVPRAAHAQSRVRSNCAGPRGGCRGRMEKNRGADRAPVWINCVAKHEPWRFEEPRGESLAAVAASRQL